MSGYILIMVEYLISAKEKCSDDWIDQIASHPNVRELARDMRYILIEVASEEIIQQLISQFPHLKFDEVIN